MPHLPPVDESHPAAADMMRVLAVGTVGWFHIWQQSWVDAGPLDWLVRTGASWVDVLILLSAFCLYLPYARAQVRGQAFPVVGALHFYCRRAVRILPSYYVNIFASLAVVLLEQQWSKRLAIDLFSHLTLTQMLFPEGYRINLLNGVTWTLSVLAGFYLLFPLLARGMFYHPLPTAAGLFALQAFWRWWAEAFWRAEQYESYYRRFTQLPAYASTLAAGMLCALLFAALARWPLLSRWQLRAAMTAAGAAALLGMRALLQVLSYSREGNLLQLTMRTPFAVLAGLGTAALSLGLPVPGKKLWAFLAGISYNFYLWHQILALWMKYTFRVPAWTGETPPNQTGDLLWMHRYHLQSWLMALGAALLFTYLVEKPAARALRRKMPAAQAK